MNSRRLIRSLTEAEVAILVDWADGEGWNPGLDDAAAFHAADPEGFIGAFVDGEMVAGIAAVAYGADYGFIGLYICRPESRGQGHGRAVWDAGMARLAGRTVGLDGVAEQQASYRGMGFAPTYRTVRFSGRLEAERSAAEVKPVTTELMALIPGFDRQFFPAPRPAFLDRWLGAPHIALAIVRDAALAGYGVIRQCRDGWKVGPLFADAQEDAESLVVALASSVGGGIHIDVPETNAAFIAFVCASGLAPGFETMRMYKGPAPSTPAPFAVTSLELG